MHDSKDSSMMRFGLTALALLGVGGAVYWLSRDPVVFDK